MISIKWGLKYNLVNIYVYIYIYVCVCVCVYGLQRENSILDVYNFPANENWSLTICYYICNIAAVQEEEPLIK
jgi:hypothetical protein